MKTRFRIGRPRSCVCREESRRAHIVRFYVFYYHDYVDACVAIHHIVVTTYCCSYLKCKAYLCNNWNTVARKGVQRMMCLGKIHTNQLHTV